MDKTHHIAVISAGLGMPSSSHMLAENIATEVKSQFASQGVECDSSMIYLRKSAVDIGNNMLTGFAPPALAEIINQVVEADSLIVVSPVFSGSYSGLFKSFFDILDPTALEGKPVIMGATGGSIRHSLMLDHAMRPLFTYLKAQVMTTSVYAAPEDWAVTAGEGSLQHRISRASKELVSYVTRNQAQTAQPSMPSLDSKTKASDMQVTVPFEELLAQVQSGKRINR